MSQAVRTTEVLVHGYIREIKCLLSWRKLIPECIVKICCLFYSIRVKILMHFFKLDTFHIIDKDSKNSTKLETNHSTHDNEKYEIKASCYISNIANINKNGILCLNENIETKHIFPSILLFNNYNDSKYDISIFNGLNNDVIPSDNMIYCGDNNNCIIYAIDGNLYRMSLENIDLTKPNSLPCVQINCDEDNFCYYKHPDDHVFIMEEELSMSYLYNKNKLFAIICILAQPEDYESDDDWGPAIVETAKPLLIEKHSKFGIFDLIENKWTYIDDFYFNLYGYETEIYYKKVGIAKYNYYDLDTVYTVSDTHEIKKYNMSKNQWITLMNTERNHTTFAHRAPNVWFDNNPNILYYSIKHVYGLYDLCYIDLRNNEKQSIKINKMNNNINYYQCVLFV